MPSVATIAIIDDDEFVRDALQTLIESVGYATMAFSSAEEYVASERIQETACLITDVQMAGMTGFDLHDSLTRNGYSVPVILMTGLPPEKFKARATRCAGVDLLSKPISLEHLMACLKKAISRPIEQPAG